MSSPFAGLTEALAVLLFIVADFNLNFEGR